VYSGRLTHALHEGSESAEDKVTVIAGTGVVVSAFSCLGSRRTMVGGGSILKVLLVYGDQRGEENIFKGAGGEPETTETKGLQIESIDERKQRQRQHRRRGFCGATALL